ncbi:protein phosphatase 2C domain-containing protein [Synechococcus sp. A10-1-5-1]|uniref:PP2C family serine/threonine-protein phosphatase n=1 Tax=Synechococcus sp. A10-1-5-1 TaxID=2936507 RepID=UPI00200123A0|nr:PP2C family serine/threonine-protein phosphatase [Synechococcus sp. A10-1-5-1]UPM49826.1 protein phosphatase 2C domain-containing protein [Synechococcus sp. A10-1-5-1]
MRAWSAARHCSVIGAAHRRQSKPCQDASQVCEISPDLQLLLVSDGHGGSRYRLSDVGSRLACLAAEQAVAAVSSALSLKDEQGWRQQLERELPAAIEQRWLRAIEEHWSSQAEAAEASFSSSLYGCTLGMVLLTPQWWGCTGIGDWDLVAIQAGGEASLVNQEQLAQASGEATLSLCQSHALSAWTARAQLHPHPSETALVLCTDGIRKSCATDADFLQLCLQMLEIEGEALAQGLKEITAQGSGDDVSVAIAQRSVPANIQRSASLATLGVAAAVLGAGLWWWWLKPSDPLTLEIQQLCGHPERIEASLKQRRQQFQALLSSPAKARELLDHPQRDPLGALIARSAPATQSALEVCPALEQALRAQWKAAGETQEPSRAPARP